MSRLSIGETLKEERKSKAMTQKQVAVETGIHNTTISQIESGRFTGSLDILERYVCYLGFELNITPMKRTLPDFDDLSTLFSDDED